MTDNPQWQPGQPPPPPSDPSQQPYAGQPQQPYAGQPQQAYQRRPEGEERTWMILAHLSAPIAMIVSAGWLTILGPLLVWLFKKDSSPAVRQAAAGAFNFNLSFWVMTVIGWICFLTIILIPVAVVIWIIVFLVALYAHLRGAWLASKGQVYTYPFQLPVLS
ncbi:DUF4870 domain-containing protein [Ornithinimicrobium cavernae]|uniref:DUF4870 domain-containing protein n=1 Tax=Ornithinimicrobium cavernae TaxID=2666047 RepID=UPI000D68F3E1|nr:DUF4870 domain-containing protein [Ornithinimicrobium cavernae]